MWSLPLLIIIGYIDWQYRRIPNSYLLGLLGLGIYSNIVLVGGDLTAVIINIIIALALTLPGYIKGVLGGGDVKLMLAITPLYAPLQLLLVFSIGIGSLLLLMTFLHIAQRMPLTKAYCPNMAFQQSPFRRGLPLGTAVVLGALTLHFQSSF
ncbi:prepilin peptidase CpaA [Zhongshania antarctica]|jgi:prepilin peptidase CpaA|uniref:Prepilin peptidase CpaA n=1 Tax=Zhongshania antarctica TaxID=641702 RepID=A0A840R473_9GAMM|nr:A24 family peptidase [Zhongshania antarctica]MBB5187344.1 prepilin peptidase CpaA [Zhongshania antarctica]